ncbi:LysR family transcriptional regulator [Vibrio sp. JC009]|uniref:LysR family transcriptional regulator n=1 Tax=Vibrio sp. JC009 TaxID=2912314 RepID=UPI0023B0FC8E|nr:LysR family transcriptional regulator [Vibrio sp. JC009]WED23637.1 LysR family transcriptional regulator [Vibrio sp. JC009]
MHKFMEQFLEIASNLSITVASKKLCVSQPTLTHNMKKYEQALGVKLFERTARGIQLTHAGDIVFEKARAMKRIQDSMTSTLDNLNLHHQKELRVGSGDAWWILFLKDTVHQYSLDYPNANIHTEIGNQVILMDKLLSDEIDLFIGHELAGLTRTGQVIFKPMITQPDNIYVRKGHPLAQQFVENTDLERFPIINIGHPDKKLTYLLDTTTNMGGIHSQFLFDENTSHYTNSLMVAIDWISETDGIFPYPQSMKAFFKKLDIVPLQMREPMSPSTIGIYMLKEKAENKNLQDVVEKISKAAHENL